VRLAAILTAGVAALALWGAAAPAGACACGVAIEATVTEERALVIEQPPSGERIVLSLDLASDSQQGRAAVVLPVPSEPTVAAIERGDPLAYLDRVTAPEVAAGQAPGGGETAGAPPPVDVIGRDEVGGYDVSRLNASDPEALGAWLDANGYSLPPGAEPILADYVDQGWAFVAIRLAPGSSGRLKPLDVSFETDRPVYPMRLEQLASDPVSLTLYALANGERAVPGLQTIWSGAVDELSPPPPPELADLFAQGTQVTRMEADAADPAGFVSDLVIEPVDTASPAPPAENDAGLSALAIAAICVAGAGVAAALYLVVRGRPS
jgi:hypothetical protein